MIVQLLQIVHMAVCRCLQTEKTHRESMHGPDQNLFGEHAFNGDARPAARFAETLCTYFSITN